MGRDDLRDLIRRQPFVPVRIFLTDGKTVDIHHPDQIYLARTYFQVPAAVDEGGYSVKTEYCSFSHLVRVDDLAEYNPTFSTTASS